MINAERQVRTLEIINERGAVSVRDLSAILGVSEMTVRRDLRALEAHGAAERIHGGARAFNVKDDLPYQNRSLQNRPEKEAIAQHAVSLVESGETVFLGGGSTVALMAESLRKMSDLTIVTHSVKVVQTLLLDLRCSLVILGGVVDPNVYATVNQTSESSLLRYRFTKSFLGATGIIPEAGFYNANQAIAYTESLAAERSTEFYVLADHSKFGKSALVEVAPVSAVTAFITDQKTIPKHVEGVRQNGGRIIVVEGADSQ